ncbi:putative metalloprotease [Dysgonomonas sp. PH5-45]|uniref:M48 family metalloprotease n=1 Tax=unclassified Dysgonomonas TaxID=2630389 RepID=UPI0024772004|nr:MULTISPECIES: M48 family metalloprotease [unclassified Dysgonomonas]MDH6353716.1 putative metalloprotease [Dysgonomonas sp. PH5-45]MDH6386619.1 putative metalloprotease [Dysgonomonas sp. PH5-37]
MKKILLSLSFVAVFSLAANAQFGKIKISDKTANAALKTAKAFTLTDAEIAGYAQEYMDWSDANNPLCKVTDKDAGMKAVATRLAKIVERVPIKEVNGMKLDIQAYYVVDINAFACANGSIRVFAGLMDIMTDDEILAIIGHEIGHVANKDSKDAFKTALLASALRDAASSAGGKVASLNNSQLGELSEALGNAQFSQKQEYAADKYGFEFMKKASADPKAMASSLGNLLKLQQEAGASSSDSKINRLFSTHPNLDKRIATLNKMK